MSDWDFESEGEFEGTGDEGFPLRPDEPQFADWLLEKVIDAILPHHVEWFYLENELVDEESPQFLDADRFRAELMVRFANDIAAFVEGGVAARRIILRKITDETHDESE